MTKNILIIGGGGILGTAFAEELKKRKKYNIISPSRKECNISKINDLKKHINNDINLVINCAGLINVDEVERDPNEALHVHILGVYYLNKICKEKNIDLMLFGSTVDNEITNVYALTKKISLQIPDLVEHKKTYRYRLGWLFGNPDKKNNFVEFVINNLKENNKLGLTDNYLGSPAYVKDVAKYCIDNFEKENYETKDLANEGTVSKYTLAKKIAKILNIKDKFYINNNFKEVAKRCKDSSVKGGLRPYEKALKEYLYEKCNF